MKLYTEEQVHKAFEDGYLYHAAVGLTSKEQFELQFRDTANSLTPIELPSDEEIEQQAHLQYPVNLQPNGRTLAGGKYDVDINYSERNSFIQCAKWMRNKILGGNK